jgi:hypothetical protein
MGEMGKVVGINLAVLLILTALFMAIDAGTAGGGGTLVVGMLFLVPIQTLVCFIAAIVLFSRGRSNYGAAFIVAALMVAVVGFSACWGGMMVSFNG